MLPSRRIFFQYCIVGRKEFVFLPEYNWKKSKERNKNQMMWNEMRSDVCPSEHWKLCLVACNKSPWNLFQFLQEPLKIQQSKILKGKLCGKHAKIHLIPYNPSHNVKFITITIVVSFKIPYNLDVRTYLVICFCICCISTYLHHPQTETGKCSFFCLVYSSFRYYLRHTFRYLSIHSNWESDSTNRPNPPANLCILDCGLCVMV